MRKRQQIQKQATIITNTRTMRQKSKDLQQKKVFRKTQINPTAVSGL